MPTSHRGISSPGRTRHFRANPRQSRGKYFEFFVFNGLSAAQKNITSRAFALATEALALAKKALAKKAAPFAKEAQSNIGRRQRQMLHRHGSKYGPRAPHDNRVRHRRAQVSRIRAQVPRTRRRSSRVLEDRRKKCWRVGSRLFPGKTHRRFAPRWKVDIGRHG